MKKLLIIILVFSAGTVFSQPATKVTDANTKLIYENMFPHNRMERIDDTVTRSYAGGYEAFVTYSGCRVAKIYFSSTDTLPGSSIWGDSLYAGEYFSQEYSRIKLTNGTGWAIRKMIR